MGGDGVSEAAFVEVVQYGSMKGCARVEGRCPACGVRDLALGAGCRVTCANLNCPDPSAADDLLDPRQPTVPREPEFTPCAEAPHGMASDCFAMDCENRGCAVAEAKARRPGTVSLDDLR